jgi:two-component system response regulator (stage 0 sporulation protein F)
MPREHKGDVLIVDDEPDIRQLFSLILRQDGWRTQAAANGKEALEMVRSSPPDVVVLDQRMPEMTGAELCERLREEGLRCPVILVSAASDVKNIAERVGIDCYLSKPVDIATLIEAVKRAHLGGC